MRLEEASTAEYTARDSEDYLCRQLITYLGNKRALLDFIGSGLKIVKNRLGKEKLSCLDAFSGSGVVSRYLKAHASILYSNDIERYAQVINSCYLANKSQLDIPRLSALHGELLSGIEAAMEEWQAERAARGIISRNYAPADDSDIKGGERVFYTSRNAAYLDATRSLIGRIPEADQAFFLGPLLAEASIHANTSGVFKGFYKDSGTGLGRFGGRKADALSRILGEISLPFPLFSDYECEYRVLGQDANSLATELPELDIAYLDPPYNQHPYGSNYFMLNLLVDYREPLDLSPVSGIPAAWKRSAYNRAQEAATALTSLVSSLNARFLLISFNSEGFIGRERMLDILSAVGKVDVLETRYNAFRGSRNLGGREIHVKEFLYLVERC